MSQLYDYGIQNDESDLHIHIGFQSGKAFIFPTESGKAVLDTKHTYKQFKAGQRGVKGITGIGYKVPPGDIKECVVVDMPEDVIHASKCEWSDSTSVKGQMAVVASTMLLKQGLIKLPIRVDEISDKTMQIKGMDLIIISKLKIQVKCDWWAHKHIRLQTAERNPLNRY